MVSDRRTDDLKRIHEKLEGKRDLVSLYLARQGMFVLSFIIFEILFNIQYLLNSLNEILNRLNLITKTRENLLNYSNIFT